MKCAVVTCQSYSKKGSPIRFYSFPKDEELRAKWILFCNRPEDFKFSDARICSLHFKPDNFERNLQFEMGLCSRNGYRLKPNIVPTLLGFGTHDTNELLEEAETVKRVDVTTTRRIDDTHPDMHFEEIAMPSFQYEVTQNLEREIAQLKRENKLLQQAQKTSAKEIKLLKDHTMRLAIESGNLENKLLNIFSRSQVKKIKGGDRRIIWTDEDVEQSMKLYSISSKAYKHLLEKGFPLPSIRTLQNWFHKIRVNPDEDDDEIEVHKDITEEIDFIEQITDEVEVLDDIDITVHSEIVEQDEIWEEFIEDETVEEIVDLKGNIEILEEDLWT